MPGLDLEVESQLFRIAQEAVSNALTHGKGDRIEISLSSQEGKGLLSIRDTGVGIPQGTPDPHGIGLHTMAYRARLIGGSLAVRPRRPRGTVVTCVFPLPETPAISAAPETPEHPERTPDDA